MTAATAAVSTLVLRTNVDSTKHHISTGCPDYSDPANNREPVSDAGLCGRLDVGARYPYALEWDPATMEIPGYRPEALCGDCRRIWEHMATMTERQPWVIVDDGTGEVLERFPTRHDAEVGLAEHAITTSIEYRGER